MGKRKLYILVAFLIILLSMDAIFAQGQGNGNNNNGNGNGNDNNGNNNGNNNNGNGNGNGNGNNGNNNGNSNNGNGNGNGNSSNGNGGNGNSNGNGSSGSGNGNGNDNGNGNGNNGNGNGNGNNGNNNGNGNNGNGNGNGNNGNGNGNKNSTAPTDYEVLTPTPKTGQERASCKARGACYGKTLVCPSQCAHRKPKQNKKKKGCYIDCSSKCEATCKRKNSKFFYLYVFITCLYLQYILLDSNMFPCQILGACIRWIGY